MTTSQTTISCRNCGQPVPATLRSLIDVMQDPQGKADLLTGRLNAAQCPNCGQVNAVMTPLLYHDATKELLIAFVPMELNLDKDAQERAIGEMMNRLPKDNFKAYMFQPKRALTMQGLVEQVLEADGVTPEVMEKQKERVRLVQSFIDAPPDELDALISQHEAQIDVQFIQTFTLIAQRMLESGQQHLAQRAINAQNRVVIQSAVGQELLRQQDEQEQVIEDVAAEVQALGQNASHEQFLDLALRYSEDEQRLQALVGLVRPMFDYAFFQAMTARIGAAPAGDRDRLSTLRDTILDLTTAIDQQSQQMMQQATAFLQALVNSPDPRAMIEANITLIDDTLLSVLAANIQEAERRQDLGTSARLKDIHNLLLDVIQNNMQPELRFVNDLLLADDDAAAQDLLRQGVSDFGPPLLDVMQAVEGALDDQGQDDLRQRLAALRQEAASLLGV